MTTLLIATRNRHKVQEIQSILGSGFRYLTLAEFPAAPEVVEDADTFEGNASKKAIELAEWWAAQQSDDGSERVVIADDSGLEVDALNGAPGVYSARFAAMDSGKPGNSPDGDNNAKLLRLLASTPLENRTARFRCAIAWTPVPEAVSPGASEVCLMKEASVRTRTFDGACEGRIMFEPSGQGGFGYDPLFVPVGYDNSFAELGEDVKNRLSHRANALAKLAEWLRSEKSK